MNKRQKKKEQKKRDNLIRAFFDIFENDPNNCFVMRINADPSKIAKIKRKAKY